MLARIEESVARLSQFAGDVAHEIRTPLTVLRGNVEVALQSDRVSAEDREHLGSVLEECEALARLVDRLLFLARTENPAAAVKAEPTALVPFLRELAEIYGPVAEERGLSISASGPDDAVAEVDRGLLQRAVSNLIENAIRHTDAGSVTLSAAVEGDRVRLLVADTGEGIAPEHLPRIFDRLFRVEPNRPAGAGLGLAIVQRVAQLHHGSVEAESQVGRGTRISILLQARPRPVALGAAASTA